ncbi:heme-binding protein 2-like isoform X2 [Mya arenaria]|uniref:heme-binding protein 2-like isoform X2 n=1 Tax=Mya arenaria TaxID=6604 RepID=UPI0022E1B901|nr:heme-binding protein 2-like isoform X2 [Mya arenaria]
MLKVQAHFVTREVFQFTVGLLCPRQVSYTQMNFLKTIGQGIAGVMLEKPKYKLAEEKAEGYEERHYEAARWVSTNVQSMSRESAGSTGFRRLFKYITGENKPGIKVDMTAPVATRIVPGAGPNCESSFTVSFYIPPKHQDSPPEPTGEGVFIEEFSEMTVYVSSFGGFASEEQWIDEARILSEKLKDKSIHQEFYFTAGYDSPFKLFNRCNEVWFVKK